MTSMDQQAKQQMKFMIDCGSHIGDGSIPIAEALIHHNRGDITVYAIDPSIDKCQFISYIANVNGLYNITVINVGLSNVDNATYTYAKDENWVKSNNTGGIRWLNVLDETQTSKNREKMRD